MYLHTEIMLASLGFVISFCSIAATNFKLQYKPSKAHEIFACMVLAIYLEWILLIINPNAPIRYTVISKSKMILANDCKSTSVADLPIGKPKVNCSQDGIQQSWRNWNVQSEIYKSPFHFHEYYKELFDPYWSISWEYLYSIKQWVLSAVTYRACWLEPSSQSLHFVLVFYWALAFLPEGTPYSISCPFLKVFILPVSLPSVHDLGFCTGKEKLFM